MALLLPVFPLPLCLFQEEILPLHIFEPRYQWMVAECSKNDAGFVLLPLIRGERQKLGTIAKVHQVVNTYSGGPSDIMVKGLQVAEIIDYYAATEENRPDQVLCTPSDFDEDENKELTLRTDDLLHEVLQLMGEDARSRIKSGARIPEFVHKLGLSPEQEYELLQMEDYAGRQQWILHWLKELFRHLSAAERIKKAIAMNGHFREINSRN
jgi:Lon protease-like protein